MYENNFDKRAAEMEKELKTFEQAEKRMKRRMVGLSLAGLIAIGAVTGAVASSTKIRPGFVGIVYSLNGGIKSDVLVQGLKWHRPWEKVKQYSVATEQAYLSKEAKEGSKDDDSFNIPTSDGKTVNVDLEFSYYFDPDEITKTFTKFKGQDGKTIEDTFIRGKMKAWAGEVSSTFSVLDIYGERRSELNAQVQEHVAKRFAEYGIVIDSVNFSRIELDASTEEAIQKRINSQQALEQEKIEKDKATIIAEKNKITAQGEADSSLIKAQGEAKANEALQKSITEELIRMKEAEARVLHGWIEVTGANTVVTQQGN